MTYRHRVSPLLSAALLWVAVAIVFAAPFALSSERRLLASASGPSREVVSPDGSGRDLPWWPWILAFPGLGVLLWWRLREMAPPVEKPAATSGLDRSLGLAGKVEVEPAESPTALGAGEGMATDIQGPAAPGSSQHSEANREVGVPSSSQTITSGTDTAAMAQPRIILTPRTSTAAYAYWELPPSEVDALARRPYPICLKLHDVTDVAQVDGQVPPAVPTWDCTTAAVGDCHLPIARANRDYLVELGYGDDGGTWHTLARSAPVRVSAQADGGASSLDSADAAVDSGAAAQLVDRSGPLPAVSSPGTQSEDPVQTTGLSHIPTLTEASISVAPAAIPRTSSAPARASLTAPTCRSADAVWELSPDQVNDLRTGKRRLTVRLYDVTELPGGFSLGPNSVQEFEADLAPQASLTLPIAIDDRDYLIEVGYLTGSGQWQVLAKSSPVRVPAC